MDVRELLTHKNRDDVGHVAIKQGGRKRILYMLIPGAPMGSLDPKDQHSRGRKPPYGTFFPGLSSLPRSNAPLGDVDSQRIWCPGVKAARSLHGIGHMIIFSLRCVSFA